MLLKNKKTGEIVEWEHGPAYRLGKEYSSLKEFSDDWEDAPKSKLKWHIGNSGIIHKEKSNLYSDAREAIGNSFETENEARQAVKRLEALKRLRDKGFKFTYVDDYEMLCGNGFEIPIRGEMPADYYYDKNVRADLEFLFGEE